MTSVRLRVVGAVVLGALLLAPTWGVTANAGANAKARHAPAVVAVPVLLVFTKLAVPLTTVLNGVV